MRESTTSFLFPDLNVWLALSHQLHPHHLGAVEWFNSLASSTRFCFCRLTQIGLLRLLTTQAVMGPKEVLTQRQAWQIYDRWLGDERILFVDEPATVESYFRAASQLRRAARKDWSDSYMLAFALSAGIRLVTFDKGMARRTSSAILLSGE